MILNEVDTRMRTLSFFDGFPSNETTKKVYDNLDFMKGLETYLNGFPSASTEGIHLAKEDVGANELTAYKIL